VNVVDLHGKKTVLSEGYAAEEGIPWARDGAEIFFSAGYGGFTDTIYAVTKVLDVKETSKGDRGIVTVETKGINQRGEEVCYFRRKLMVWKRDQAPPRRFPYDDDAVFAEPSPTEAAVLFLRKNESAKLYRARLAKRHGKAKSLTILAHKIARAVFFILKRRTVFQAESFFA